MPATDPSKPDPHASTGVAELFHRFSEACAQAVGSSWTFVVALGVVVAWAVTGPMFDYSDTWQLLINTGTTIVTFLMVFLIQNAQNRDAQATQLKLDELIRALQGTRKQIMDAEDLSDAELSRLKKEFERMGEHPDDPVRQHLRKSLGQGPRPPVEHPPRHLRCAAPAPAAAPSASNFQPSAGRAPGKPAMPRQVQHEEYSQPLRASQRQWT